MKRRIEPSDLRTRQLCDNLDAAVFSGDWLTVVSEQEFFRECLERWGRELTGFKETFPEGALEDPDDAE